MWWISHTITQWILMREVNKTNKGLGIGNVKVSTLKLIIWSGSTVCGTLVPKIAATTWNPKETPSISSICFVSKMKNIFSSVSFNPEFHARLNGCFSFCCPCPLLLINFTLMHFQDSAKTLECAKIQRKRWHLQSPSQCRSGYRACHLSDGYGHEARSA